MALSRLQKAIAAERRRQEVARQDYKRWLVSICLTPSELAATRALARKRHSHDYHVEDGVATVLVTCKCGSRQGAFKDWVTAERR